MTKRKYFRINDDSDYPISLLDHELDMGAVLSISQALDVINELQAVLDQIVPVQTSDKPHIEHDPLDYFSETSDPIRDLLVWHDEDGNAHIPDLGKHDE